MYEKFPPYTVEEEAQLNRAKQKEKEKGSVVQSLYVKTYRQVLARIVIYGAPVQMGVVVRRVCMQG